jgi:hypothetical protein
MATTTNQITVYDLYNTMREKSLRHHECFTIVLDRIYSRIRRCASVDRLNCVYEVPEVIIGKPLFDVNKCIRYVMRNLTANGFRLQYFFPRTLVISWDVKEQPTAAPTLPWAVVRGPGQVQPPQLFQNDTLAQLPRVYHPPPPGQFEPHFRPDNVFVPTLPQPQPQPQMRLQARKKVSVFKSISEFKPNSKLTLQ